MYVSFNIHAKTQFLYYNYYERNLGCWKLAFKSLDLHVHVHVYPQIHTVHVFTCACTCIIQPHVFVHVQLVQVNDITSPYCYLIV